MSADNQVAHRKQSGNIERTLQRLFMMGHVSLYRLTKGAVGSKVSGMSFLILTTIGRKSGVERHTPLFYFSDGRRFIVIASNGGAPKHPTWWLNLQANLKARVQVGGNITTITASEAEGEERERLWSIIAIKYKNFVGYQKRTARAIPVVILTPDS